MEKIKGDLIYRKEASKFEWMAMNEIEDIVGSYFTVIPKSE